jgi:hypothetical protein
MTTSEPPELPEPEVEYRRPAWIQPPPDVVPGVVPVELLLAHTDTDAVLVTGLRAYPTGVDFVLTARLRPGQPTSAAAALSGSTTTSSTTTSGSSSASPSPDT